MKLAQLLLAFALLGWACSSGTTGDGAGLDLDALGDGQGLEDDGVPNDSDYSLVRTVLSDNPVAAGAVVEVSCVAQLKTGFEEELPSDFTVTPSTGIAVGSGKVTTSKAGAFEIACKAPAPGVKVLEATLEVAPGLATSSTATVEPAQIVAGGSATLTCAYLDKYKNALTPAQVVVEAPEGVLVEGLSLSSTVAGKHDLRCLAEPAAEDFVAKKAVLTVTAGPVVGFKAGIKPVKEAYPVGQLVTITHAMSDQYGNPVDEVPIQPIVVEPADAVLLKLAPDRFTLLREARISFSVTTEDGQHQDTVSIICDTSGPDIVLQRPKRGETIIDPNLTVSGTIQDKVFAVIRAEMDDAPLTLDENGAFAVPVTLSPEMNLFHFEAEDERNNLREDFVSCFQAPKFSKPDFDAPGQALLSHAAHLFLSQELIDDGERETPPDDLAGILEQLLVTLDLAALLPATQFEVMDGFTVTLGTITFDSPRVLMSATPDGLAVGISIPNLEISLAVEMCTNWGGELVCNTYEGLILAEALEAGALVVLSANPDGTLGLAVTNIELNLLNPELYIQGIPSIFLSLLLNSFIDIFKGMILTTVEPMINETIQGALGSLLGIFQDGLALPLPALPGMAEGAQLKILPRMESLLMDYDGIRLSMKLEASMPALPPQENLGSLVRGHCGTQDPGLSANSDLELSLDGDFAAQILWALWNSSTLQLKLDESSLAGVDLSGFGISGLNLALDFRYAPYPSTCGKAGAMNLQVGDLLMDAKFKFLASPWEFKAYLYLKLDATLGLGTGEDGNPTITVDIADPSLLEVNVVEVNDTLRGKEEQVVNLIKVQMLPTVLGMIREQGLAFALPSVDLGAMLGLGIPMELKLVPEELEVGKGRIRAALDLQ